MTLYSRWTFFKLNTRSKTSGTVASSFYFQQSTANNDCGGAYSVTSTSKYYFITGQIANGGDCYTGAVVKVNQDNPTFDWISARKVAVTDLPTKGQTVFNKIARFKLSNSWDFMWMCGYNQDSSSTQAYF